MQFSGYLREDGRPGIRNYLAIMSSVCCANEVSLAINMEVRPSVLLAHSQGCGQTSPDVSRVSNTLIGLGKNPNVAAVLLVSLGCESVNVEEVANAIAKNGKPVEVINIQETGGSQKAVSRGVTLARKMVGDLRQDRVPLEIKDLVIGLKCGASDSFSGLITNPVVGRTVDQLVDLGTTVVFGEITEMLGAEHIIAHRIKNPEVRRRLFAATEEIEKAAIRMGVDMRGGQPSPGNIKGGLTTIEEKSLGAIIKSGTKEITGFLEYGEKVEGRGVFLLDSPGREPELLTGLAAAGAQVIIFTTGLGAPQGYPIVPVIKVGANRQTNEYLDNHVDLFFTFDEIQEPEAFNSCSKKLLSLLWEVCSGKLTKAEINNYSKYINIYVKGPVL
jgi:altronate dehydratase large subunit